MYIIGRLLSHALTKLISLFILQHSIRQCAQAALLGYRSHCFEPSPKSFQRITRQNASLDSSVSSLITLYNRAVGATTGEQLSFSGGGGTGDHVGEGLDVWAMTRTASSTIHKNNSSSDKTVMVETIKLDDIILLHKHVFVIKIDTQGFEPAVFAGLDKSLRAKRVSFVLFEYWPRGMDFMNNRDGQCIAASILKRLASYGYRLVALSVSAHPKAGREHGQYIDGRPMSGFQAHCMWYYELERLVLGNRTDYRMGYWSDILAVAPHVRQTLVGPVSPVGQMLSEKLRDLA
jgi:FkbM family methyltransferase